MTNEPNILPFIIVFKSYERRALSTTNLIFVKKPFYFKRNVESVPLIL